MCGRQRRYLIFLTMVSAAMAPVVTDTALAGEPFRLSEAQMDQVTAGDVGAVAGANAIAVGLFGASTSAVASTSASSSSAASSADGSSAGLAAANYGWTSSGAVTVVYTTRTNGIGAAVAVGTGSIAQGDWATSASGAVSSAIGAGSAIGITSGSASATGNNAGTASGLALAGSGNVIATSGTVYAITTISSQTSTSVSGALGGAVAITLP